MRLYFLHKHGDAKAVCLEADDRLIYRQRPGLAECSTNSQGYVDHEHAFERPGTVRRIVVIGDSVASGQGVPFGTSFPLVLEELLNRDGGIRTEVIILAVPGYSTSQEIVLLREQAFRYDPNLIIIAYHPNDLADPFYHNANGQVAVHFKRPASYAWFYLKRLVFRMKTRYRAIKNHCREKPWCVWLHCVYRPEVEESFTQIATIAEKRSTPLVFAFLPLLLEPEQRGDLEEMYRNLTELAERNHLASINLMAPFEGRDVTRLRLPGDHWHPNEAGHRIIAEALYRFLRQGPFPATDGNHKLSNPESGQSNNVPRRPEARDDRLKEEVALRKSDK